MALSFGRGQNIGRYVLLDRVAVGRAEVFRAFSPLDDVEVTLKLFRAPDQLDETTKVQHPNLATVLERGAFGPNSFVAREFIHGADLDRVSSALLRRRGPDGVGLGMSVPHACYVFARLADGLDAAHRALRSAGGGIHGDLRPEHLLVGFDGAVKVINFRGQPIPGKRPEKISYRSPEETEGRSIGSRSDVYSLAACLLQLLGGGHVTFGLVEPIGFLDEALQAIVLKALSRAPGERHRWPSELAADLDGYLASTGQVVGRAKLGAYLRTVFDDPGSSATRRSPPDRT